ncbi:hypothetical protein I2494_04570 [Budviciaceae bacterium BWR-B9]|uniref:Transcriptional regulator n=2 Tax=Budviciaceae TaxID=1903416 RepID=A0ABS1IN89_9GAMM|nr:hypothetical protein [Limnobaculum allomyrinae]MBV7693326.1 hypothetical protein [Limnobaculum sp. M2-1]
MAKTHRITAQVATVYYHCQNDDCGSRLVYDLTYSHHTRPSALTLPAEVIRAFDCIPPEKRREVAEMLLNQNR